LLTASLIQKQSKKEKKMFGILKAGSSDKLATTLGLGASIGAILGTLSLFAGVAIPAALAVAVATIVVEKVGNK
jgi:hypothetical protein